MPRYVVRKIKTVERDAGRQLENDPMTEWRKVTAEQFLNQIDPTGDGWDEARVMFPDGLRREVWDVGGEDTGEIAIYTSQRDPLMVPRDYPISVR